MAKTKHGHPANNIEPAQRFPSQALLSALALIPTVVGTPIHPSHPPAFLCPCIERDLPTPTLSPVRCDVVADRYVQGSDSLWRKTDSWTLYGSTCRSSLTDITPTLESHPHSSQTLIPTPFADNFDTSVLPAGWNNAKTHQSSSESTIILALAIILAGFICVFMIGCVIWRRRKKRARDIERKLAHKHGTPHHSQDNPREKDARGKMRIWAKATARWKSNIRQSARRRRKRQFVSPTPDRPLSPTLSDLPQLSLVAPSPSRRGSITSDAPDPSIMETDLCLNNNLIESPAVLHDPPRSASPPTYGTSFSRPPPSSALRSSNSTLSPVGPSSAQSSNQPSVIDDEPLRYLPPSDGHVATDDKSRLAHIQELASSPPMMVDMESASTIQSVSAPGWHEIEDDLGDLCIDLSQVPTSLRNPGLPPSFPPPPSEANVHLSFGYLDDHPLRYGEVDDIPISLSIRPSLGPSPSAPPLDDLGLEPSAPSLEGDEFFQDWDGASFYIPEVPTSGDLDPAPARAIKSPISSTVSSASRASFPLILESAARDGILPRYHP